MQETIELNDTAEVRDGQAVVRYSRTEAALAATYASVQMLWEAWRDRASLSSSGAGDAPVETGWMPIESAPKDGREVILRRGTRVGAACWTRWPDICDSDGALEIEGGEGWTVGADGDEWADDKAPTHWQPLPPPPGSSPIKQEMPEALSDSQRLDWLDETNKRFRMGWKVGMAPAGNVSVQAVIQLGTGPLTTIREAIDAAKGAAK